MKKVRSGFTLIELLVVIAIIAILAAILLPVFAAARERARQSTCASNLKQLGIATMQYYQDFDEVMPWIACDQYLPCGSNSLFAEGYNYAAGTGYIGWPDLLYPYVKSKGVYVCPDVSVTDSSHGQYATCTHYAMSIYYMDQTEYIPNNHCAHMTNISKIHAPANKIMWGEPYMPRQGTYKFGPQDGGNNGYGYGDFPDQPLLPASQGGNRFNLLPVGMRHNNGTLLNYGYADGHVKASSVNWNLIGSNHNDPTYSDAWDPYWDSSMALPSPNSGG